MRSRIVWPDGAATELITVRTFDAAVKKCARLTIFDSDDVTAAVDELDRQASAVS